MEDRTELNFDGLVGPTYHFGGLSYGNTASMKHQFFVSSPKKAALQGLKKMKFLADLNVPQAVLPPQERPNIEIFRNLGFKGPINGILEEAAATPFLLEMLSSASSMWAANSATVAPSCDTPDQKVHISIANLLNRFHRSIESKETYALFQRIFADKNHFTIHPPLPKGGYFGDEGAANHIRFSCKKCRSGVHLFVYGKSAFDEKYSSRYPARQALEASQAIARRHGLSSAQTIFARQNPDLINLGVFHNDVISMGHQTFFFYHEAAFLKTGNVIEEIKNKLEKIARTPFNPVKVTDEMLPLKTAVESYFFNSQIVTLPDGSDVIIAPEECRNLNLEWLSLPVYFLNVKESMQNGGGPACLRLRMELTPEEIKKVHQGIFLSDALYLELVAWVEKHYRDELTTEDLQDPALFEENQRALDELTSLLHLGSFYSFQKDGA